MEVMTPLLVGLPLQQIQRWKDTVMGIRKIKKIETSGSATNTVWSTQDGVKSIKKPVTPSSDKQSRSK